MNLTAKAALAITAMVATAAAATYHLRPRHVDVQSVPDLLYTGAVDISAGSPLAHVPSASTSTPSPVGSSSGQMSAASAATTTWKTYTSETYNFQLRYPQTWTLTRDVAEVSLPLDPLQTIDLVSTRSVGSPQYRDSEKITIAIAVYAKRSDVSFSDWLSHAYGKDAEYGPGGNIYGAIAAGHNAKLGIVCFQRGRSGGIDRAEIGTVAGGVLFYAGIFSSEVTRNVYVLELHLRLDKTGQPTDAAYAETFNEILSSVIIPKSPRVPTK